MGGADVVSAGRRQRVAGWLLHHLWLRRRSDTEEQVAWRRSVWLARAFAIGLVMAALGIAAVVYPRHLVLPAHPSLIDELLYSRAVFFVFRVVSVFVVGFVVASLLARIWNGQWLQKAGPFEVAADVRDLTGEAKRLANDLHEAEDRIEQLQTRVTESDVTIEQLLTDLEAADQESQDAEKELLSLRELADAQSKLIKQILPLLKDGQTPAE